MGSGYKTKANSIAKIKHWQTHTKTVLKPSKPYTLFCTCIHKLTLATLSFLLNYWCLTLLKLHETWWEES